MQIAARLRLSPVVCLQVRGIDNRIAVIEAASAAATATASTSTTSASPEHSSTSPYDGLSVAAAGAAPPEAAATVTRVQAPVPGQASNAQQANDRLTKETAKIWRYIEQCRDEEEDEDQGKDFDEARTQKSCRER
jgi:hypothetical protein